MTTTTTRTDADRALKAKHRAIWASGDYAAVAADLIPDVGAALVARSGIQPGQRVLDVAAGTGNAAIPAALAGARVTASDLTPELFAEGRRAAAAAGVELDWVEADAEALPFGDGEFDRVLSCLGVMFAPHHEDGADELVRVTRPGGTIGLLSWTPRGYIGQMFATMKPFAPPPPPGAQPPPLWGDAEHVTALLGDRVEDLAFHTGTVTVRFDRPEQLRDYFKANYGPTIAVYEFIAGEPEKVEALDRALVELVERFDRGTGTTVTDWEYLIVTARRRA